VLVALLGWAGYQGGWYLWARSHFQDAQQAVDRHDWPEAHKHLQACLLGWPNRPAVHLLAARIARRLENLEEAQEHLDTCQRLQGEETRAIQVERALLRVHHGELSSVEDFLRSCVQEDNADAVEILDVLSAALFLKGRTNEAMQCVDDLLQRQPDHFDGLVKRGRFAENLSWNSLAVESYQKALDLRPDVDNVRLSLAELQVALGRFTEARVHFEYLRERQSRNPSILFGLARCLAGEGQKEQALKLLDRLLAAYPSDWKALGERGWLSVQLDRPAEGEPYLRRAIALAPPDLPLLVRLSECLRLLDKPDEARAYREKADQLQEDFGKAEQLGTLIREKSPDDPNLRNELGRILLRLGKPKDAFHWFQTALEKDPKHRPTHQSLVEFYEQVGDPKQAAYHRQVLQELGGTSRGGSP
jgi:tetratricopeptide (TPR) repeat protein